MKWKKVIVALVVLGVLAAVVGSPALAAEKAKKSEKSELDLLDPFTLQRVAVSSAGVSDVMLTRQAIRVPLRPACRSAFRPEWH